MGMLLLEYNNNGLWGKLLQIRLNTGDREWDEIESKYLCIASRRVCVYVCECVCNPLIIVTFEWYENFSSLPLHSLFSSVLRTHVNQNQIIKKNSTNVINFPIARYLPFSMHGELIYVNSMFVRCPHAKTTQTPLHNVFKRWLMKHAVD